MVMDPEEERLFCHKMLKNLFKKSYENNVTRFLGTLLMQCGSIFMFFFFFISSIGRLAKPILGFRG